MTEPILKLDNEPEAEPSPQRSGAVRWIVLGIALMALFAGVVVAMLFAMPRPHTPSDYMIAGGLATMITMLALFGVIVATHFQGTDAFYRKRPK